MAGLVLRHGWEDSRVHVGYPRAGCLARPGRFNSVLAGPPPLIAHCSLEVFRGPVISGNDRWTRVYLIRLPIERSVPVTRSLLAGCRWSGQFVGDRPG